jgi:hypothetical protein
MFKSCGEPDCLVENNEETFRQFQLMEARYHANERDLVQERERADDYKERYYEEQDKKESSTKRARKKRSPPSTPPVDPAEFINLYRIFDSMRRK